MGRQAAETSGSSGIPNKRTYLVQAGGRLTGQSLHATQSSVAAPPQGANVAGDLPSVSPQLALLTLAQCRKRGGGDASSSRSLCKALADRSPYWQRGPLELLNRLHNASSGPGIHFDAHVVASSDLD